MHIDPGHGGHVVIVGMMGTGKSTVGLRLGRILARPVFDTDKVIEERSGRTVRELFAEHGEAGFRVMETETLERLLAAEVASVISCGGGIVTRDESRLALRTSRAEGRATVVWLRARDRTISVRVGSSADRPMLDADPSGGGDGRLARIGELSSRRNPLYAQVADVIIDTDRLQPADVCAQIVEALR